MKKTTKNKIHNYLYPIFKQFALGQFTEPSLERILNFYIKFLDWAFKLVSSLTFMTVFLWFLPTFLKVPFEKIIIILLCVLILQIRAGVKTKFDDENE